MILRIILLLVLIAIVSVTLFITFQNKKSTHSEKYSATSTPSPPPLKTDCVYPSQYTNRELFPIISSLEELKNNMWYDYIDAVYGIETIGDNYPIEINRFVFLYTKYLPDKVMQSIKDEIKEEPCIYGDFYSSLNQCFEYCDSLHVYIYPVTVPFYITSSNRPQNPYFQHAQGFASHSWVEVIHCCCDLFQNGYWFYVGTGSGIWYNVGKTIVFEDHVQAYCYFYNIDFTTLSQDEYNTIENKADKENYLRARQDGYDSIQYLYRLEWSDTRSIYKTEIQDLRHERDNLKTFDPCPDDFLSPFLRTGWWKTSLTGFPPKPLECESNNRCLNTINRRLKNPCPKKKDFC